LEGLAELFEVGEGDGYLLGGGAGFFCSVGSFSIRGFETGPFCAFFLGGLMLSVLGLVTALIYYMGSVLIVSFFFYFDDPPPI